jgi:PhnB protein
MTTTKSIPIGFKTVTPYLAVHHVRKTIDFLKMAFDAEEVETHVMPDGRIMNAIIRIYDSMIFMGERPLDAKPWPAMLYMYVENADSVFSKAVEAGGKIILKPKDQFYGERSGAIEDPSGNQWWISTHIEDLSNDKLVARAIEQDNQF